MSTEHDARMNAAINQLLLLFVAGCLGFTLNRWHGAIIGVAYFFLGASADQQSVIGQSK